MIGHSTQESVWDYPRPPLVEPDGRLILVASGSTTIAETRRSSRVLETSHPPVFYLPPEDVDMGLLTMSSRRSFCEFKGQATYWDLDIAEHIPSVGWSYRRPTPGYEELEGRIAFYPSKVSCFVDSELARPQPGDFYGGWITSEIGGPFKGGPRTRGW